MAYKYRKATGRCKRRRRRNARRKARASQAFSKAAMKITSLISIFVFALMLGTNVGNSSDAITDEYPKNISVVLDEELSLETLADTENKEEVTLESSAKSVTKKTKKKAKKKAKQGTEKEVVVLLDTKTEEKPETTETNDNVSHLRGNFTEEEKLGMGKVVWKEARGEPYLGKVAVAAVILNRLDTRSGSFGASSGRVMDVITYPWAFASIQGFSNWEFKQTAEYPECMRAVEDAIFGNDPTRAYFENGALYFYSAIVAISESEMRRRVGLDTYQIGNHIFHITLN